MNKIFNKLISEKLNYDEKELLSYIGSLPKKHANIDYVIEVNVGFNYDDETQFDISILDKDKTKIRSKEDVVSELEELIIDFCKENKFSSFKLEYVEIESIQKVKSVKSNYEKLVEILTDSGLDWNVELDGESITLSTTSPAGQDCNLTIMNTGELLDQLMYNYEAFDPSYETYLWVDETGHGKNGAPHEIIDIYNDMKWLQNELHELCLLVKSELSEDTNKEIEDLNDESLQKIYDSVMNENVDVSKQKFINLFIAHNISEDFRVLIVAEDIHEAAEVAFEYFSDSNMQGKVKVEHATTIDDLRFDCDYVLTKNN